MTEFYSILKKSVLVSTFLSLPIYTFLCVIVIFEVILILFEMFFKVFFSFILYFLVI